jgi:hypothetical protein
MILDACRGKKVSGVTAAPSTAVAAVQSMLAVLISNTP